jgi:steroid 5-alpha reductase family enzyme
MARSYAWVLTAYLTATAMAVVAVGLSPLSEPLWVALFVDLIATVVVFAFSYALKNSSMYDPFWSVAPIPIVAYWMHFGAGLQTRSVLVLGLVVIWGVRLTVNWIQRWGGLLDEDWRYEDLKRKHGRAYWPVSFAGIHLFPTLLVFLGLLPAYVVSESLRPLGWLDGLAGLVVLVAIAIEARSDAELRTFLRSGPDKGTFLASGLWNHSRHPNYFGEVLFWWGIYGFGLAAGLENWWTVVGAVSMTLLFRYVSIPMMDARMMSRKPGYDEYARRTSRLLPWPRIRRSNAAEG